MSEGKFICILSGFVAAIILGLAVSIYYAIQDSNAWDTACRERGGEPVRTLDAALCLSKDILK